MGHPDEEALFHDWNRVGFEGPLVQGRITLLDETLRDGIQSPSAVDPSIEDKKQILRYMARLGIGSADIGLPGAGKRAVEDVQALCETIRDERLPIAAGCAARTHPNDIQPIIDLSRETGVRLEVLTFLGTSPIRQYAENWDLDRLEQLVARAVDLAVKADLPVAFVTEDTVRSSPRTLERLFRTAIDHGAQRLVLCDTVGHATPDGIRALVQWTRELVDRMGATVGLDWHGHNDRGLAVVNSLYAAQYGCDRIHGTALGIGERVGNAALDQILVNLRLLDAVDCDLSALMAYCRSVSEATKTPIPRNYPVVGEDAFRTATGVHAAAIIKAREKGDAWLADRVYSGVPASMVGKHQIIEIGHMSGESNVTAWLADHGYEPSPALVAEVFRAAKRSKRTLHDDEILAVVRGFTSAPGEA
ncbi:MAG: 2-isopropylmalate synthase [Deltaproteobacteria bacterium]|nr:2-isopropylmalate synthase [Deltaproteobacteria bacterium]MCB9785979.1 2-isopropylmalate synthase [Deltaproteobacteria bacterium]